MNKTIYTLGTLSILHMPASADVICGIDFPQGDLSLADQVLEYNPGFGGGNTPTHPEAINPNGAIGLPNITCGTNGDFVSLGAGGLIKLAFVDNVLTNSGDGAFDLHVFEIGPDIEDTFVALRPADAATQLAMQGLVEADGYVPVGLANGALTSMDLDAVLPGFAAGTLRFDAIRLIDDINADDVSGQFVGADIDAVGAISSAPNLFVNFCNGNGDDALGCGECPCGNNAPSGTQGGCLNSSGDAARLSAAGSPSLAADTLSFAMVGANPSALAILCSGDNQLPQQGPCPAGAGIVNTFDGLRCIGGGLLRHGARQVNTDGSVGISNQGWGPGSALGGSVLAQGSFAAGQVRHFQALYREFGGQVCNSGVNTSNGVSVQIQL